MQDQTLSTQPLVEDVTLGRSLKWTLSWLSSTPTGFSKDFIMNTHSLVRLMIALGAGLFVSLSAQAQVYGTVISSTAIQKQTPVTKQVCTEQQVVVPQQKSGAGTIMGGIAGGTIGNAIGKGDGNALATVLGVVGGAMLGDKIEGEKPPRTQIVQNCTNQTVYETRITGYQVVYEYAGKRYTVEMPRDPGPTVTLQVTPVMQ
jgi:uncharacterized protein YcfJ